MMNKALVSILAVVLLLSGCATTSLYDWGSYEEDLFEYLHEPDSHEKVLARHLKLLEKNEQKEQRPAPGLLAEAGTYYLQAGDVQRAVEFYRLESETWPESRPLMDQLIANLEKR